MSSQTLSRRGFLASSLAGLGASMTVGETTSTADAGNFPTQDAAIAEAWRLVEEYGACRVIIRECKIVSLERGRGLGPFLRLLETRPQCLKGAIVVDSVLGVASAAVAVKGGSVKVLARTASKSACEMLARNGIPFEAKVVVPHILNRNLTGICPLEASTQGLDAPDEIIATARKVLASLRSRKMETVS